MKRTEEQAEGEYEDKEEAEGEAEGKEEEAESEEVDGIRDFMNPNSRWG